MSKLLVILLLLIPTMGGAMDYNRTNLDRREWDKFEASGEVRTIVANQYSDTLIIPLLNKKVTTSLTAPTTLYGYNIAVVSAAGMIAGDYVRVVDPAGGRYYSGRIVSIATNTLTMDTQIDYVYVTGSQLYTAIGNMAVNGSVTPVVFKLRLGDPSIPKAVDITQIIIQCTTSTAVDLNKFGNLAALARGVTFRRVNGHVKNVFNVKTNFGISGLATSFESYKASNPAQAVDGFVSHVRFAGQGDFGVALRVESDGNIEVVIQDNLTGLLALRVVATGHVVQ